MMAGSLCASRAGSKSGSPLSTRGTTSAGSMARSSSEDRRRPGVVKMVLDVRFGLDAAQAGDQVADQEILGEPPHVGGVTGPEGQQETQLREAGVRQVIVQGGPDLCGQSLSRRIGPLRRSVDGLSQLVPVRGNFAFAEGGEGPEVGKELRRVPQGQLRVVEDVADLRRPDPLPARSLSDDRSRARQSAPAPPAGGGCDRRRAHPR